jgi:signal recognition particle receptor subunit beta
MKRRVRLSTVDANPQVNECGKWPETNAAWAGLTAPLPAAGEHCVATRGEPDEFCVTDGETVRYQFSLGFPIRSIVRTASGHCVVLTSAGATFFRFGASPDADEGPPPRRAKGLRVTSAKILIAGAFGAGVTTAIGSVSEIRPVTSESIMTTHGVGVDDNRHVPGKMTLTTAFDFGRISLDRDLILYLFGTPGPTRFWFMWDEMVRGAIGAVLVLDARRLADGFAPADFFEHRRLPYVIAINRFDDMQFRAASEIREALAVADDVPVVSFDARDRESVKNVIISLVEYVLTMRRPPAVPAKRPRS